MPTSSTVAAPTEPADLVTGLEVPWSVAFLDDTAFVSNRDSGRILEIDGATSREVGTVEGVEHAGEGGLLGLAVLAGSPNYLYAYFTGADDNRIVRYALTGGPGSYGLGQVGEILSGIPKAGNHDGGRIKFGPDGMLYVTSGDAGESDNAQDPDSVSGKILRLDPSGAPAAGNPIPGNPMWSIGHRNPQGIGWQADGTMWAAEFGQDTWDELNIITPGANYGWPEVEGIGGDSPVRRPGASVVDRRRQPERARRGRRRHLHRRAARAAADRRVDGRPERHHGLLRRRVRTPARCACRHPTAACGC